MKKYGYGAPEESLYLQAYNLAKAGNPTLLFSFESDKTKLMNILTSHLLKIEMEELNSPSEEVINQIKEAEDILKVPLSFVDTASLDLDEIEKTIGRNKAAKKITHVVFDRVDDAKSIDKIAARLSVEVYY